MLKFQHTTPPSGEAIRTRASLLADSRVCRRAFGRRIAPFAVCAFSVASIPAFAQTTGSRHTPDDLPQWIDSSFASMRGDRPGCAVGVARTGLPVLERAYGMADLEHGVPLTPASIFESGSLAKQFTAAAMVLLAQDGKLSLDDDVRRYLPELPDFGSRITIRHLLTHTSGLREQWSLLALTGNPPGSQVHTLSTILDLVSRQRALNFVPGSEFFYTNTGYALAAIIVQRVSGRSLPDFTAERLFKPLRMSHTQWRDDFRRVVIGRALAYAAEPFGYREDMPFTNVIGNGGLLTTVDDLLRWNTFLDAPETIPGGASLVSTLQTRGHLNSGKQTSYGLGLEILSLEGEPMISHSGSTAGYKTWLGRLPRQHISVALLCNDGADDIPQLGARIAARALAQLVTPAPARPNLTAAPTLSRAAPAALPLEEYVGFFRDTVSGNVLQIVMNDGRLTTRETTPRVLVPAGGHRFRLPAGREANYVRAGTRFVVLQLVDGADTTRLIPVMQADGSPAALGEYLGTYYSTELDIHVTIALRNGGLVLRQPFGIERPLTAVFAGGFTMPLRGTTGVVFSRAASGRVDGLGMWLGGARNVRFVRE
jgi:CubicO group peptidase (beta-lactamase class C family)